MTTRTNLETIASSADKEESFLPILAISATILTLAATFAGILAGAAI